MGGESLESIKVEKDPKKEEFVVKFITSSKTLELKGTELNKVRSEDYTNGSSNIEYCIIPPYNGLGNCANLFNPNDNFFLIGNIDQLNNTSLTNEGDICKSLIIRPGSIITHGDTNNHFVKKYIEEGRKCVINRTGVTLTTENINNCCINQTCKDSPFSNKFTTHHCNDIMQNYCKDNYGSDICLTWLEARLNNNDSSPIKIYHSICKDNLYDPVCDYFSIYTKTRAFNSYSNYSDSALDNFCTNHKEDVNCKCYLSIKNHIVEDSENSGPLECWMLNCSSKTLNSKWLTMNSYNTKTECQTINCVISIDRLIANKGHIELKNNCLEVNNQPSDIDIKYNRIKHSQTWGSQINPFFLILCICFCILSLISF